MKRIASHALLLTNLAFPLFLVLLLSLSSFAQEKQNQGRTERTIDEIRTEAIHRAEVGQYPLIGLIRAT